MLKWGWVLLIVIVTGVIVAPATYWVVTRWGETGNGNFFSAFVEKSGSDSLQAYSIPALAERDYQISPLKIEKVLAEETGYTAYLFSFQTLGKKMTGQLNVPTGTSTTAHVPAIVMLRGYVPPEIYETGEGTRNAAVALARAGFVTVAPDFFGYGGSDPEPTDSWQARFEKPIIVIELMKSLNQEPIALDPTAEKPQILKIGDQGLWGHSNGGQIALTVLEILGQPMPTTLWAPVTAPFPYSILFFSDESEDEGKAMRLWLAQFEKDYNVFDFSLTQHLDRLSGPIQLHHGTGDEAALEVWSQEFGNKVKAENKRRQDALKAAATASAGTTTSAASETASASAITQPLPLIDLTYFTYPGADHNLQPGWNTVVERDIAFFKKHL